MRVMRTIVALLAVGASAGCYTQGVADAPELFAPGGRLAAPLERTLLMTEGCTAVDVGGGMVLTAEHCVTDLPLGEQTSVGMLFYKHTTKDFAMLLDIDRVNKSLVKLRKPVFGEHIVTLGYPVQIKTDTQELTITDGLVAGPTDHEGCVRITAPIYYGNSGGGVWGDDGALVGLSVNGFLELPGMNYIVPADEIAAILPTRVN